MTRTEYCDSCSFCTNAFDDSDESVGLYGMGCDKGEEEPQRGKPCPFFNPIPSSTDLMCFLI